MYKKREDNERGGSDYLRKAIILNINFLLKGVYYSREAINWGMDIIQGNMVFVANLRAPAEHHG